MLSVATPTPRRPPPPARLADPRSGHPQADLRSLLALLAVGAALPAAAGNAAPGDGGSPAAGATRFASGLQAAIDATPNGGTVEVRPGVYGELIRIKNRRGLKIISRGAPALVLHQATDWTGWQSGSQPLPLLVVEDSTDIHIENVFFRRDVKRKRDPFRATTATVTGSKRVTLEHVYLGAGDGKALEVGSSEVSIVDSTLEALQYGVAEGNSTVTIASSSIVAEQVPTAVFTQGCGGKDFRITRSYLTGRIGLGICKGDYERLRGNVIAAPFWKWSEVPEEVLEAQRHNTVVGYGELPDATPVRQWRPDDALLSLHLEDFAELPRLSTEPPKAGTDWFLCARDGVTDWRLFPDGPTTARTMPIPLPLPSCAGLSEAPAEGTPVRVLARRGAWLEVRPDRAYIETGPHRVEQGFWLRAETVSTPCVLRSGAARIWTRLWSGSARHIEVIDARRVSVRGATDYCGDTVETLTVEVPPSLRPATARTFQLECSLAPNPSHCGR